MPSFHDLWLAAHKEAVALPYGDDRIALLEDLSELRAWIADYEYDPEPALSREIRAGFTTIYERLRPDPVFVCRVDESGGLADD